LLQLIPVTHPGGAEGPASRAAPPPDAGWSLVDEGGRRAAGCSLWWTATPPYPGHRLGVIGGYSAQGVEAGTRLLGLACEHLARQGCTLAVGPMDGSTWRRYRCVIERGTEPPFFLEPDNPDDWPAQFAAGGFTPLARYYSNLNTDIASTDPRVPGWERRAATEAVRLRPLDPARLEDDLYAIARLSLESFARHPFYTPVSPDELVAEYLPLRAHVRPELVYLAECRGRLMGYVFGLPDLLQAQRGAPTDTAVLKTIAVRPNEGSVAWWLAGLLTTRFHVAARELGYTRVIYALMHERNRSHRGTTHCARTIRCYALFARSLGGPP
jgi:hypothetical protein